MKKNLVAILLLCLTYTAQAQIYAISSCSYSTIAGSGTALPSGDDQVSAMVPIGFTFNFYGTNYTQLAACTNGWLTFNSGMPATYPGQTMPYASIPTMIAWSWDDMYTVGGTFEYFTTGVAPNRICVINYNNIGYCCSSANMATVQIQLYETTNEIRIESANNIHSGRQGTMGIQDAAIGATVVPGRNATSWNSAANECISFLPCTPPSITISQNPPVAPCGGPVTLTANGGTTYDQDQPANNTCMATFGQADLAQSFIPLSGTICGAGIFLTANSAGSGTITIQLYNNLPNAGGVLMASGSVVASDNSWADVSWPSVTVTPGNTYYLVFTGTNTSQCIAGSTSNPYSGGMTYANSGYGPFPSFDYTFHTRNCTSGPPTYLWSTGATTSSISVSASGTYSVSVTVGGCPGTASIVVNIPVAPVVIITQNPPVAPCGGPVTLSASVPTYDQNSPSNNTCMANFSQADLAQSFIPSSNTICGAGIFLTANSAGSGTVTIQLYNNLPNAGGVLMATGTVVASDNSWADVTWSSVSVIPGNVYYLVFTSTNTSQCVAGNTADPYPSGMTYANAGYGAFPGFDYTFHTTNCNPPSTYLWSTGATTSSIVVSASGTYTVAVTVSGCTGNGSIVVTVPVAPTSTGSFTNVSCNGGSNGTASVVASGGTPGYSYSWAPSGGTGATATGLTAGAYTCTITDASGCTTTGSFTITAPSAITSTGTQTNVSCNGGTNGSASVAVSGGTPGYTYSWAPSGGTAATTTGRPAGIYTCTITDANGCVATRTFNITAPSAITSTGTQTNVSCNGGTNGSASVAASGGTPGYTYSWAPSGGTAATATGLGAGTYTCTITDANSCVTTRTFTIAQPVALSASSMQTNVSCNGGSNGDAMVMVSGGTPGYSYLWAPSGGTGATATGLTAGMYTVTVTDANLCTMTQTFNITAPTALAATSAASSIMCNGGTATVTVTGTGGTSPYTGNGTFTVTAGTYSYTVTDANGCTAVTSVTVTEPTALAATSAATSILCNGGTATVTVTGTGGTSPYTGEGTFTVTAGTYSYTVTDANGCTVTTSVTVTEPTAISVSVTTVDVLCNGGSTGSIDLTVSGGTGPYTFDWNSGTYTTEDISGLTAGVYTGVLTDANGCTNGGTVTINEPAVLAATLTSVTDPTSCGGTEGAIDITVTGGVTAYGFLWSNGAITEDISGIGAGGYTCTITDANGCTTTVGGTLNDPNAPTVTLTIATDTACLADGAFTLTGESPIGGTFSGPGVSAGMFDPATAGAGTHAISYTYTDISGCTGSTVDSIYVDVCLGANAPVVSSQFTVYPNPNNGNFILTYNNNSAVDVLVYDALGQIVSSVHVAAGASQELTIKASGVYTITCTTAQGVQSTQRVVVNR